MNQLDDTTRNLIFELVLSADKDPVGNETSHELAEISGRKGVIVELLQKIGEL